MTKPATPGLFITLEGIEGSGKSTQARRLLAEIEARQQPVVATHEPGDTVVGRRIRAIVLDPIHGGMQPLTELLLYCADRADHTAGMITPALDAGKIVLCDRYSDATRAYQGIARGLGLETVERLNIGHRDPDLTVLFDLPAGTGLARARNRNERDALDHESRFEREQLKFHEAVRSGYLTLAAAEPARFRVLDAAQSEDAVFAAALAAVSPYLDRR